MEQTIGSFRLGLDTRPLELTQQPGSLVVAENGHINEGGQFEKRFAFVKRLTRPGSTFGGESTSAGFEIYGSRPATGTITNRERTSNVATVTLGTSHGFEVGDIITITGVADASYNGVKKVVTAVTSTTISYASTGSNEASTASAGTVTLVLPSGFVYVRLQHPAVVDGATYDANYHLMTAVNWSYTHVGLAWVSVTFSDTRSFLYYNGTIISQSKNGLLLPGLSAGALRTKVANDIASGFAAVGSTWGTSTVEAEQGYYFYTDHDWDGANVLSPPTVTFTSTITETSASGYINTFNRGSQAAQAGAASTATYTIAGVLGDNFTILAVSPYNSTTNFINLVGEAFEVAWAVSDVATATALVAAINAKTGVTGYSASNGGGASAVVTVTTPIALATAPTSSFYPATYTPTSMKGYKRNGAGLTVTNRTFSAANLAYPASGQFSEFAVEGTWAVGETWSIAVVSTAGNFTLGKGRIAGLTFVNGFVFKDRGILANGTQFNLSSIGDVTAWETQNTGAGFVSFSSQKGQYDTVQGFAAYQGKLVVFGKQSTQIWQTNADIASWALQQTLNNLGTRAPFSIGTLGELEALFLADNGIRSLRTRETSLNAFVNDIGSPIDSLIKAALNSMTETQVAASRKVVESGSNRYWLFLSDRFYVLSYFPASKVTAWSTYLPSRVASSFTITVPTDSVADWSLSLTAPGETAVVTICSTGGSGGTLKNDIASLVTTAINALTSTTGYSASAVANVVTVTNVFGFTPLPLTDVQTGSDVTMTFAFTSSTFVPTWMTVHNGQVYICTSTEILTYGGLNRITYDNCVATLETPWLDDKSPTVNKTSEAINAVLKGVWTISASMDARSALVEAKPANSASYDSTLDSTYGLGTFGFSQQGTHHKMRAVSSSSAFREAKLGSLTMQYEGGQNI